MLVLGYFTTSDLFGGDEHLKQRFSRCKTIFKSFNDYYIMVNRFLSRTEKKISKKKDNSKLLTVAIEIQNVNITINDAKSTVICTRIVSILITKLITIYSNNLLDVILPHCCVLYLNQTQNHLELNRYQLIDLSVIIVIQILSFLLLCVISYA